LDKNGVPVPVAPPNPTGDPSINAAMEKLKPSTGPIGSLPAWDGKLVDYAAVAPYQQAWKAAMVKPEGFKQLSKAEKDAWYQKVSAAQNEYVEMQKRTGLGPGGYVGR
jgi:hypothetical protein